MLIIQTQITITETTGLHIFSSVSSSIKQRKMMQLVAKDDQPPFAPFRDSQCLMVVYFWSFWLKCVMPHWVKDLIACWRKKIGNSQSDGLWKILSLCLMWCIWTKRNDQSFENNERMIAELKVLFFHSLFQWIAAYDFLHIFSFHDLFWCFSCVVHVYLVRILVFDEIFLLIKINKKKRKQEGIWNNEIPPIISTKQLAFLSGFELLYYQQQIRALN